MSVNVNAVLRSIKNREMKQVVQMGLDAGFVLTEGTADHHCHLVWPTTAEKVGFSTNEDDRNAWKGFARQLERVSKTKILPEQRIVTPKVMEHHRPESMIWGERVHQRMHEYSALELELRIIMMAEAEDTDINRVMEIVSRMGDLKKFLGELHQPLPKTLPLEHAKELEHAS